MTTPGLLRAREAYARRAWRESHAAYAEERNQGNLDFPDFEKHATTSHLVGDDHLSLEILSEGYREAVRHHEAAWAARYTFWIGQGLFFRGEFAQASGWFARGKQLLASHDLDCVEHGYLKVGDAVSQLMEKGWTSALGLYTDVCATAERFSDPGLGAMGKFGLGRGLIESGDSERGMALLDETIIAITLGEMPPMVIGDTYCGVLEACHVVLDFRRAREWTEALAAWCDAQPDLVPYRGPCRVYRAEILQFNGAWNDALDEAKRARDWLCGPLAPEGPGEAHYRLGEIHRLRGELDAAEECYRQASRSGRPPDPGLALLHLSRGNLQQAESAIHRAMREEPAPAAARAIVLDAALRISDATGDLETIARAADELSGIATTARTPALWGLAARAQGLALLLRADAEGAIRELRRAWTEWQRLGIPYEAGLTRVLLGRAYLAMNDHDAAAMEFDAARWVFVDLGALYDLAELDRLAPGEAPPTLAGPLTHREREVLALIAAGRTNKEIGVALVISEHTVARHVQNMMAKLGMTSRTSLAAFAVENGLAPGRTTQI